MLPEGRRPEGNITQLLNFKNSLPGRSLGQIFGRRYSVFVSYYIVVVLLWARWGGPDGIEV